MEYKLIFVPRETLNIFITFLQHVTIIRCYVFRSSGFIQEMVNSRMVKNSLLGISVYFGCRNRMKSFVPDMSVNLKYHLTPLNPAMELARSLHIAKMPGQPKQFTGDHGPNFVIKRSFTGLILSRERIVQPAHSCERPIKPLRLSSNGSRFFF